MKYITTIILALGLMVSCTASKTPSEDYIWLSLQEAEKVAEKQNVPFRIIEQDGEAYAVTKDYIPGRINAVIEDGKVKSYEVEWANIK